MNNLFLDVRNWMMMNIKIKRKWKSKRKDIKKGDCRFNRENN